MPFLRFTRDRRGIEHTFVMHAAGREGRPRLLYWFRTPPHVKVGRPPLDEEAIRLIEEHNPGLSFDWTRILKTQAPAPVTPQGAPRRRRPGPPAERPGRREPRRDLPPPAATEPPLLATGPGETGESAGEAGPALHDEAREALFGAEEPAEDADAGSSAGQEPGTFTRPSAVEELLGPEQLLTLRARYGELLARISGTVAESARREVLRTEAAALNPDTWVTAEEVTTGVATFEERFAALRERLGRPRRRSRRGGARRRRGRGRGEAGGGPPASYGGDSNDPEGGGGPAL